MRTRLKIRCSGDIADSVFVAQNPEQFAYDADFEMHNARCTMHNDCAVALAGYQPPLSSTEVNGQLCIVHYALCIDFAYDHKGRMVTKRITENDGNDTLVKSIAYVWDGWNIIREIQVSGVRDQGSGETLVTDNVWGLDLDGTMQGAGGVGGLLAVVRDDGVFLPTYDANGNISEYVTTNGEIVAHYDYSPFGETLFETGDLAATFTHRFSTKPWCPVTGLCEYQMRKYRPEIGRWMSRDPAEENDFLNIYEFVGNFALGHADSLGLWTIDDSSLGQSRLVYIKGNGDSISSLASLVDLDPKEAKLWGKIEKSSGSNVSTELTEDNLQFACSVSVPNVWIDADLLRRGTLYDRFVNIGGTIGSFFGTDLFTSGIHQILTVGTIPDLMTAVVDNKGDLWGMTVYGHGSKDGWLVTPDGDGIPQIQLYYKVLSNGYKLSAINMMQCYSGGQTPTPYGPIDMSAKWRSVALHPTVYKGVNVLGMDLHL